MKTKPFKCQCGRWVTQSSLYAHKCQPNAPICKPKPQTIINNQTKYENHYEAVAS